MNYNTLSEQEKLLLQAFDAMAEEDKSAFMRLAHYIAYRPLGSPLYSGDMEPLFEVLKMVH